MSPRYKAANPEEVLFPSGRSNHPASAGTESWQDPAASPELCSSVNVG